MCKQTFSKFHEGFCCNCQNKGYQCSLPLLSFPFNKGNVTPPSLPKSALTLGDVERVGQEVSQLKMLADFQRSNFDKVTRAHTHCFLSIPKQPYSYYLALETVQARITSHCPRPAQGAFSVLTRPDPDLTAAFSTLYFCNTATCSNSFPQCSLNLAILTVAATSQGSLMAEFYYKYSPREIPTASTTSTFIYLLTSPKYVIPFPELHINIPNFLWTSISSTLALCENKHSPVNVYDIFIVQCMVSVLLWNHTLRKKGSIIIVLTISHEGGKSLR